MKPFKITLIHINDQFNLDQLDNMPLNINIKDSTLNKLTEFKKNNSIQLWRYIFIGSLIDKDTSSIDDISDIISIIEDWKNFDNDDQDPIGEENINILNTYFNYNIVEEWGIDSIIKGEYNEVRFIYTSIQYNHTLDYIKQTILHSIKKDNPTKNYITPEHQCLVSYLVNNVDDGNGIYSLFNNKNNNDSDLSPEQVLLHNMFNNRNIHTVPMQLKSIGCDLDIITNIPDLNKLKKYFSTTDDILGDDIRNIVITEQESYDIFINNSNLLEQVNNFLTSKICTHSYSIDNKNIYLQPFLLQYLNNTYTDYSEKYEKTWVKQSNYNVLLKNIGLIENQTLFLYTFSNVYTFVNNNPIYEMKKVSSGFLKKYFPTIDLDNLTKEFNNIYNGGEHIINKNTYNQSYLQHFNFIKKIDYEERHATLHKISICNYSNFTNEIKLSEIFNKINLSNDIPFVKYKEIEYYSQEKPRYKDIFKIHRPSFYNQNNNYGIDTKLLLNTKQNEENICLLEVDRNISEGGWVKTKTNGLLYKIIVAYVPKNDNITGEIIKITQNYILIVSNNKIYKIPKILHGLEITNIKQFIPSYTGDETITDTVDFFDYDIIYGNLDFDYYGNIKLNIYLKEIYNIEISFIKIILDSIINPIITSIKYNKISFYNNNSLLKINDNILYLNQSIHNKYYNCAISNTNYSYMIDISKTLKIDILKLGHIIDKYLYTCFNLKYNNIYYVGDEIDYKNNMGIIYKGRILCYDNIKKNTYICVSDEDQIERNVTISQIRLSSDSITKYDDWFHFNYKCISNLKNKDMANFIEFKAKQYCKNWKKITKYSEEKTDSSVESDIQIEQSKLEDFDTLFPNWEKKDGEEEKNFQIRRASEQTSVIKEYKIIVRIIPEITDEDKKLIKNDMLQYYNISYKKCEEIIKKYIQSPGMLSNEVKNIRYYNNTHKNKNKRTVQIKIKYLKPVEHSYKVIIEGLQNINELEECTHYIKQLFNIYEELDYVNDTYDYTVDTVDTVDTIKPKKILLDEIDAIDESEDSSDNLVYEKGQDSGSGSGSESESESGSESESESEDDGLLLDDDDEDDDDDVKDLVEDIDRVSIIKTKTHAIPLYEELVNILNKDPKDIVRVKKSDNCVRDRIYQDAKRSIFDSIIDDDTRKKWSKKCRSDSSHYDNARIPKIISQDDKDFIDKYYSESYNNIKLKNIEPPIFKTKIININTTINAKNKFHKIIFKIIKDSGTKISFLLKNMKINEYYIEYKEPITNTIIKYDNYSNYQIRQESNKKIINILKSKDTLTKKHIGIFLYIKPKLHIRFVKSNENHKIKLDDKSKINKDNYYIYYKIKLQNTEVLDETPKEYFITNYDKDTNEISIEDILIGNSLIGYSYVIYEEGIDCSEDIINSLSITKNENTNLKQRATPLKCKSLMFKFNNTNRYYICPMIWDTYDNVSINPENLYHSEGQFIPDKDKDWRTSKGKDIRKYDDVHFKGKTNDAHRNIYKTNEGMRRNIPTRKESILLSEKRSNSFYRYPGFIHIQETGALWPACFKNKSENIQEKWNPTSKVNNDIRNSSISNKQVGLLNGEFGYVERAFLNNLKINPVIQEVDIHNVDKQNIFNIIPEKTTSTNQDKRTGIINKLLNIKTDDTIKDSSMIPILARKGIANTDSFLLTIIDLLPEEITNDWGDTLISKKKKLIKIIVADLTEDIFKTLNKGALDLIYRDTDNDISSYQNFIEYVLSDSEKKYYDFWDYVTRKNDKLFKDGLRLLIFEKKENKEYTLLNPYFFDNELYKNRETPAPFSIIIKTKQHNGEDHFEPLYLWFKQITDLNWLFPNRDPSDDVNYIKQLKENKYIAYKNVFYSEHPFEIYKEMYKATQKTYEQYPKHETIFRANKPIDLLEHIQQALNVDTIFKTKQTLIENIKDNTIKNKLNLHPIIENILQKNILLEVIKTTDGADMHQKKQNINKKIIDKIPDIITEFIDIHFKAIMINIYNYFENITSIFDTINKINENTNSLYNLNNYIQLDNIDETDSTLQLNLKKYKKIVINSYNKVVLIQDIDNTLIPINDEQIPNSNVFPKENIINMGEIYKQIFNLSTDIIELPTINQELELLRKNDVLTITLVVDNIDDPNKIFAIIDMYNNIIPIDHAVSLYDNTIHGEYVCVSYKVILADLSIYDYNNRLIVQQDHNKLVSYTLLYNIIQTLDQYTINDIFIETKDSEQICVGVSINKIIDSETIQLFTNVKPILFDKIPIESYGQQINIDSTDSTDSTDSVDIKYISDINDQIMLQEYDLLNKLSLFKLKINPTRYFMCNHKDIQTEGSIASKVDEDTDESDMGKKICGLILENGTKIKFKVDDRFDINHILEDNNYHIHNLRNYTFINKIDLLDNMYYKHSSTNEIIDDRIKNIRIIKYQNEIYNMVHISLQRFLHNDKHNNKVKIYITNIISSYKYNKEEKFLLIYPIIKYICGKILLLKIPYSVNNMEKMYSLGVDDLDKCYNIKLKDNCSTQTCSYIDTKQNKKNTNKELLQQFILTMNNYSSNDLDEDISIDTFTDLHSDIVDSIINIMKHLLYDTTFINCRQSVYEVHSEYEFDNLIYKFTYKLVNNYITQKSILEGIELIKNELIYTEKDDEWKFDKDELTIAMINSSFNNHTKYTYDSQKKILDYILKWNNNSYIDIKTRIEKVTINELEDDNMIVLDLTNLDFKDKSFLGTIMKVKEDSDKGPYIIKELNEDMVILE